MERINKESIADVLRESKKELHVRDISTHLINKYSGELFDETPLIFEKVLEKVNRILNSETKKSDSIFAKAKNPKTKKDRKGFYRLKRKIGDDPIKPEPIEPKDPEPPIEEKEQPENLFTGKAGECAVMSELLFRGYNVNSMLVDDGVDIVASKNNMFYYLQVKTTSITDKNRIITSITQKRFNDYIGTQIRYVVVARCLLNKIETNMYFIFNNSDIQRFVSQGKMKTTSKGISIKIEIDSKDNKPYIYDEKKECIDFYVNNFSL